MAGPAEATRAEAGDHRFHAFAWDRTPVGPADRWPESLRAAVDLMLGFGAPSALFVGPKLVQMHNPAFGALYRDEHAANRALGRSVNGEDPGGILSAAAEKVFAGRSLAFHEQDSPLDSGAGGRRFNLSYAPVRDEQGQISAMLMLALPAAEPPTRARGPLVGDLQHRVRNILAVVRSLVARSAETSDTVEDLAAHLDGRIAALARVQAVLVRDPSAGVDLERLVRDELLAQSADDERSHVGGPEVILPSRAAEVLTLAIHELATNAMKYGALSQPSGNLEITWRLLGENTPGQQLELLWRETEVRIASAAPRREGFGTNLLKRRLPYELSGSSDIEFRPGGLVCRIVFPFAAACEPDPKFEFTPAERSEDPA